MKVSKRTLEILKNYSGINNTLWFNADSNIIKTMAPQKTIVASAEIEEVFDRAFGIYDLNQLLASFSLFENPEIELTDTHMRIFSGKTSINYYYAERRLIIEAPEKDIKFPDDEIDVEFDLTTAAFNEIQRAASVLQLSHLKIKADGKEIILETIDPKNPTSNTYRTVIGETKELCDVLFKIDNLKFLKADYKVRVTPRISHFSADGGLQYWVPMETK